MGGHRGGAQTAFFFHPRGGPLCFSMGPRGMGAGGPRRGRGHMALWTDRGPRPACPYGQIPVWANDHFASFACPWVLTKGSTEANRTWVRVNTTKLSMCLRICMNQVLKLELCQNASGLERCWHDFASCVGM